MAGTRPSASVGTESLHSDPWWEAREFSSIQKDAAEMRAKKSWPQLEEIYRVGFQHAVRSGSVPAQLAYLTGIGNTLMLQRHYGDAIEAYVRAKTLAETSKDWASVGPIALNLAALYERLWDHSSAITAAEEGRLALARLPRKDVPYQTELLLQLGRLYAQERDPRAEGLLIQAVESAKRRSDRKLEAASQGQAVLWFLGKGDLKQAGGFLSAAFELRSKHADADLPISYKELGLLRLRQGQELGQPERRRYLDQAAEFTAKAIATLPESSSSLFHYLIHLLHRQQGEILETLGRRKEALAEYRVALQQVVRWRGTLPAATSTLTGSNVESDRWVFDSFVELATREYFDSGESESLRESFLASEIDRAVSLRETRALAGAWRAKLPDLYWALLADLRTEQSRLPPGLNSRAVQSRIRLKLTEMETIAGLGFFAPPPENFMEQSSLNHFQQGLRPSEIFLSFHLGRKESVLWAVTAGSIRAYRLEPELTLRRVAERFRRAVLDDDGRAAELGADLYRRMFGALAPEEASKRDWLVASEGFLFEVPMAALVTGQGAGRPNYLAEKHTLQSVPGSLSLGEARQTPRASAILVGDPIYNSADPRAAVHLPVPEGGQLNRLPASGGEIRASAAAHAASGAVLLDGPTARRGQFLEALSAKPGLIHLATHVLTSGNTAFIAFGIGGDGRPELLTSAEVATLDVPGALVVMTGCASGTGEISDGAGLQGLTRAWMTAGAAQVLATLWPVPDRGSDLMPAFYRNRKQASTAEALRRSQVQMISSGTWQALPSHWAAFQVSGGIR